MYISLKALYKKIGKSITRNTEFSMELVMRQLQFHPLKESSTALLKIHQYPTCLC